MSWLHRACAYPITYMGRTQRVLVLTVYGLMQPEQHHGPPTAATCVQAPGRHPPHAQQGRTQARAGAQQRGRGAAAPEAARDRHVGHVAALRAGARERRRQQRLHGSRSRSWGIATSVPPGIPGCPATRRQAPVRLPCLACTDGLRSHHAPSRSAHRPGHHGGRVNSTVAVPAACCAQQLPADAHGFRRRGSQDGQKWGVHGGKDGRPGWGRVRVPAVGYRRGGPPAR